MIRKDFLDAGFPISKRSPVICTKNNFIEVCYNRFDLKNIIIKSPEVSCLGIWPGKKMTDGFILDPKSYIKTPIPPEEHKDIDSADMITIYINNNNFLKIEYFCVENKFISEDINLYNYIRNSGLRYTVKNLI